MHFITQALKCFIDWIVNKNNLKIENPFTNTSCCQKISYSFMGGIGSHDMLVENRDTQN